MQDNNSNNEQSNSNNSNFRRSWSEFTATYSEWTPKRAMRRSRNYNDTEVDPYTGESFPVADRE